MPKASEKAGNHAFPVILVKQKSQGQCLLKLCRTRVEPFLTNQKRYEKERLVNSPFMRAVHNRVRVAIFSVLDIFYPLFRRFMPLQTYHYAACGGGNTLFNIFLYHMIYNFVVDKQVVHLGFLAFKPHVASFIMAFFVTFPIGFYLSMYVVFQGSYLRRRIQLVRYFMVAMACVGLNYVLLKFFIEILGWYNHPTLALIATAVIVVTFSYLSQRFFSFRNAKTISPASTRVQKQVIRKEPVKSSALKLD